MGTGRGEGGRDAPALRKSVEFQELGLLQKDFIVAYSLNWEK